MDLERFLSFFGANRHVQATIVVVLSFVAAKVSVWVLARALGPIVRRTSIDFDDRILDSIRGPIFNTVLLTGLGAALAISEVPGKVAFVGAGLIKSLIVLIWFVFALFVARLVLTWMSHQKRRYKMVQPVTRPLFEIAAKVLLFGAAVYLILISWKVDVTAWMASAGIIGLAVGFAAKDTLANLFAGVSILADTPYKVGDMIVLDSGERGRVTHIGLRSSRIETRDDIEVTVPNAVIANTRIRNESRPIERERVRVTFDLSYGIDADVVKSALLAAAESVAHVLKNPGPQVRLTKVTDEKIAFELLCWIEDADVRGRTHDAINSAAYRELRARGIDVLPAKSELFISRQAVEALAEALREAMTEKTYR